ncbi:MAG: class I adenylate-forming enzyme family protein [Opitutaceae bacterium]|jgi:acyl-coenzyme A synthetase/AMP-(fatty) acid ligase
MSETVISSWTRLVRDNPSAPALTEAASGRTWTRAELDTEAGAWRDALTDDVGGQCVTFALPNGTAWFAVFLGLLRAGATPVPLDSSEPAPAHRELAISARAAWSWIDGRLEHAVTGLRRSRTFSCLVKLTSGSTGRPRALRFTDAKMLADGRQVCAGMGITPDDVNFAVIPFGHSYGLGNLVMPILVQGTPLVCAGVPLPHSLAADIAKWKPTVFPAVPALLRALAASDLPADALGSLRTVISAGAPLSPEIARAFFDKFNLPPHSFYGSSETGGIAYDRTGEATLTGRSVGTPLGGVTITPLRGGRIRVTSAAVMARGGFSPADKVALNEHGELVLQGRAGRLMKVAGRRINLADLERALRTVPGVRDAFAAPHPQNPEELAAVLATSHDIAALRGLLRTHFAAWKIPRRLVIVAEFPLTARGKPDSAALTALLIR